MKQINLSELQKAVSLKLQNIRSSKLWQDLSSKLQQFIPSQYRKWLLLALALVLVIALACCFHNDTPADEAVTCTVFTDGLNVHKKADADSKVLSQLPNLLEIEILEQKTADGTDWGRVAEITLPDGTTTKEGWIDLQYVRFPGDPDLNPPAPTEEPATESPAAVLPDPDLGTTVMGTVTTGKLNIRKGAGSGYEAVDTYLKGDRIEILEIETVDDTVWGRTNKGWIGMGYVRLDGTAPTSEDGSATSNDLISDGNWSILGYGVVDLGELNVRSGPGIGYDKVCTVTERTRYAYYQLSDDWVRIEDGWVSVSYFYMEGTTADDATNGTIITEELNIRTGPATSFKSLGVYKQGESIEILAQVDGWGYTGKGWVSMSHVEQSPPSYTTGTGTVTSGLNVRKEPNADSEMVDTYKKGDSVTITEVKDGWGKTDKGWINLKYVKYD